MPLLPIIVPIMVSIIFVSLMDLHTNMQILIQLPIVISVHLYDTIKTDKTTDPMLEIHFKSLAIASYCIIKVN